MQVEGIVGGLGSPSPVGSRILGNTHRLFRQNSVQPAHRQRPQGLGPERVGPAPLHPGGVVCRARGWSNPRGTKKDSENTDVLTQVWKGTRKDRVPWFRQQAAALSVPPAWGFPAGPRVGIRGAVAGSPVPRQPEEEDTP